MSEKRDDGKWENEEIEENEEDGVFRPNPQFFSLPNWEEKSKENVNEKKSTKIPQSFHNSTFNNNEILKIME